MATKNASYLMKAGFVLSAVWKCSDPTEIATVHKLLPDEPGVYVFVIDDKIMYVGSANGIAKETSLRSRMRNYQRHQRKRSESRPVHIEIARAHGEKKEIEIYTLASNLLTRLTWQDLPIDLIIGLEAGLIQKFNPEWNRRGRKRVIEEVLE